MSQKALATPAFWDYNWGPAPYGTPKDHVGVLQIVNGGTDTMWIRYGGNGVDNWKDLVTTASDLNGNKAHKWNKKGDNNMLGQGDGFQLLPGEFQIVPFSGSACWVGGSLGCEELGGNCVISPDGRGSGTGFVGAEQPNTLFEWTAPGVWDASLVDGFSLPMKARTSQKHFV